MLRGAAIVIALACGCGGTQPAPPVTEPAARRPAPPIGANDAGIVLLDAAPPDALVLAVDANRWHCFITTPDGTKLDTLTVPVGRPVKLVITTRERFGYDAELEVSLVGTPAVRPVRDGKPAELVFRVDRAGTFQWKCPTVVPPRSEHAEGTSSTPEYEAEFDPVKPFAAVPAAAYDAMVKTVREERDPQTSEGKRALGQKLYEKKGCAACHSIDGTARIGPSWAGIWGTTVTLADGSSRKVDAAYIEASILHPQAFARPGFPPSMPSFEGQLRPREITALIDFIHLLSSVPPQRL